MIRINSNLNSAKTNFINFSLEKEGLPFFKSVSKKFFSDEKKSIQREMPDYSLAHKMNFAYGVWTCRTSNLKRHLKIASHLHDTGKFPFTHGQNSGWAIPQRLLKKMGYTGAQCLRFIEESKKEEASSKVNELLGRVQKATQDYQKALLSTSIKLGVEKRISSLSPLAT